MFFTERELWTIVHGMLLGGMLLILFPCVLLGLWSLRAGWFTETGIQKNLRFLNVGSWIIAILSWLTMITGTYIPYPWYRATPPSGADLTQFPMAYLLANPHLAFWEDYCMEWKEHIGWFVPILTTAVAFILMRYGDKLKDDLKIRDALIVLLLIAFVLSGISGLLGALVSKIAPVR
jgi:hypothetical protein